MYYYFYILHLVADGILTENITMSYESSIEMEHFTFDHENIADVQTYYMHSLNEEIVGNKVTQVQTGMQYFYYF